MSDWTCRGSYALGTACGRCRKCKQEKAMLLSLNEEIKLLQAERDTLAEALRELIELTEAFLRGEYQPDSFTTRTARNKLAKLEKREDTE